ncbi:MAG: glutamyl-tRNA reductase [Candidatus Zixiibacteriota bacterium]
MSGRQAQSSMKEKHGNIGIISASVSCGNLPLVEGLTLPAEERIRLLPKLKEALGVDELAYLATCNRVEFIYSAANGLTVAQVRNRLLDYFFSGGRMIRFSPVDFAEYTGSGAVRHIFRVTAALESMVIGETQITGQVKAALGDARTAGTAGPQLRRLLGAALMSARRVRNETEIGSGSLSMASLALAELKRNGAFTEESTVALVGAGEMTLKLAAHLRKLLSIKILFVNRTQEKAETFAKRFSGEAISLSDFLADPPQVDAIISATSSPEAVFGRSFLEKSRRSKGGLVCLDLAIPRDFSEDFDESDSVTLIDIAHLNENRDKNLRGKFREVDKAGKIVENAACEYIGSQIERSLQRVLSEAREETLKFAREKCNDLFAGRLAGLSEQERELVFDLLKKSLGRASADQSRALASHLGEIEEGQAPELATDNQCDVHSYAESVSET